MSVDSVLVRVSWECPFCETRRSNIRQAVDEARGRSGLLNHIRHTADEDHGEWRALPGGLSKTELDAYLSIEPVALGTGGSEES